MEWARMLAYVTGMVDQELLLQNCHYLTNSSSTALAELPTFFTAAFN